MNLIFHMTAKFPGAPKFSKVPVNLLFKIMTCFYFKTERQREKRERERSSVCLLPKGLRQMGSARPDVGTQNLF